jgi:hypothetical protein
VNIQDESELIELRVQKILANERSETRQMQQQLESELKK